MQAGKLIVKLAINPVELRGKQWYKAGMITSLDQVSDFPLCWPDNKPRAAHRIDSRFKATLAVAHRLIEDEMRRWSAKGFVVSMAPAFRRAAGDPAVALWWNMRAKDGAVPPDLAAVRDRLIDVAALAIAAAESLDRKRKKRSDTEHFDGGRLG